MPTHTQHQAHAPLNLDIDQRARLQGAIARRLSQLIDPFDNLEPFYRFDVVLDRWENVPAGYHPVDFPPLLEQLRASTREPHASGSAGGYESRPTAHLDAIDADTRITIESATFARKVLRTRRLSTRETLALIRDRLGTLTDEELARDLKPLVRSWWVSARILSGLESRPLTPHAHCPLCNAVDSLRVRVDVTNRTGLAWCKECHEAWDEDTIGLLTQSIDAEHAKPRPRLKPAVDVDGEVEEQADTPTR